MHQLAPYWQLNSENKQLIVDRVQLFLWAKGICLAGHQQDGKLVAAKAYAFDKVYDLTSLNHIIMTEPLLADATLVKQVWMAVSRNIIYPQQVFERDSIDTWIRNIHFIEHDEELATSHASDLGVDIIYPKKAMVRELFTQYFPNRTSKFLIAPTSIALQLPKTGKGVVVIFLENTCSLSFFDNQTFVHNYIFEPRTMEDIVIEIGNYWQEDVAIRDIHIIATGISSHLDTHIAELSSYFDHVNIQDNIHTQYFLETLSLCE